MSRKGYYAEKLIKDNLVKDYGKSNVIKCAIGQAFDYIVFCPNLNKIRRIVEVKSIHQKTYSPTTKEMKQFERIDKFAKEHYIEWKCILIKFNGNKKEVSEIQEKIIKKLENE